MSNSIKNMLEADFSSRIHSISPEYCSFNVAADKMNGWRREGGFSVFNAGTFDILTVNHILGLVECRALGAMAMLGIDTIKTEPQARAVHATASASVVKLMVTLDTNRALEESKSHRADKGGAPKPTLDWYTRAMMLASQSMPTPDQRSRHSLVDFITRHGPDCCASCNRGECLNEDNALMAVGLQPSLVVVNAASLTTVRDIERYKMEGRLPNTQIAIIQEGDNQYYDPVLGGPVKTTAIIERIRS